MRFFDRFLSQRPFPRRRSFTVETAPPPTILAIPSDGVNPVHRLLDEMGLPWREPRSVVEARIGISMHPIHQWATLQFPDATRPPGFLHPWQAYVFDRNAPDMPIVQFHALQWLSDDPAVSVGALADFFSEWLGPAPVQSWGRSVLCRWQAGAASLELRANEGGMRPPGMVNPSLEREPRMETACNVALLTGYRRPLSRLETEWLADFEPVSTTRPFSALAVGGVLATAPSETEVEYARDPEGVLTQVENRVGIPSARAALIFSTHQLFVLPAQDILGFEVQRLLPARGEGGSTLLVRCRTTCPGVDYKTLRVAFDDRPDGITPLGQKLAKLFDNPCVVNPYQENA